MPSDAHSSIEALALLLLRQLQQGQGQGQDKDEHPGAAAEYNARNRSYYALLGLSQDASNEQIRLAAQKLEHQSHTHSPARRNALANAKEVLLNPELRNLYDAAIADPG